MSPSSRVAVYTLACVLAGCAEKQNSFVGTWKGSTQVPDLGKLSIQCAFTASDVTCEQKSVVSSSRYGGAYTVTNATRALVPSANLDFTLVGDSQLTFQNSGFTYTLTKVSTATALSLAAANSTPQGERFKATRQA